MAWQCKCKIMSLAISTRQGSRSSKRLFISIEVLLVTCGSLEPHSDWLTSTVLSLLIAPSQRFMRVNCKSCRNRWRLARWPQRPPTKRKKRRKRMKVK